MSGVRILLRDGDRELGHVQTETEDDFHFFRDSIHAALESGDFGSRFPTFMRRYDGEWSPEELERLHEDLQAIADAFKKMPPTPLDGNWSSKLHRSGRTCASLFDVYVDAQGRPLLGELIELCAAARKAGKPLVIEAHPR